MEPSMERHVTILGAFHIAFGAIGLVAALAILLIFGGAAGLIGLGAASDPDAWIAVPIVGIVGTVLTMIVLTLSVPGIAAGFGLMTYRPWARMPDRRAVAATPAQLPLRNGAGRLWVVGAAVGRGTGPLRAALHHRLSRRRLRAALRGLRSRRGDTLC